MVIYSSKISPYIYSNSDITLSCIAVSWTPEESVEERAYILAADCDNFGSIEASSGIATAVATAAVSTATATGSALTLTIIFPSVFLILILGLALVVSDGDEEKKSLKIRSQQTFNIFSLYLPNNE